MGKLKSLKWRLGLGVFLPTLLISAIDLSVTYYKTGQIATLVQQQLLKGSARIISEQLIAVDGAYEISIPPAAIELFASKYKDRVIYAVRSSQGRLISGSEELAPYRDVLQIEQGKYYSASLRGEAVRVIAYAHTLPNASSGEYAVTQVAQTLHSQQAFRDELFQLTIREHFLLLVLVICGLTIAFRWTLRPLQEFGARLMQRTPGSLEIVDEKNAPTELVPVIHSLNTYVARLDKALSEYEQFVANTAHHLRTSFAIITSQIDFWKRSARQEQVQKEVLDAIQTTVTHGTKVINQLLVLAAVEQNRPRLESGSEMKLAELVTTVMEELAPLAHQKDIELGVDVLDDSLLVFAPVFLLREIIANLIGNSIQHMGRAGQVTLTLRREAGHILLSVADNGPGIPPALRDKVLERFFRIDHAVPNSSGLGLAIVKEICDALAAEVTLRSPDSGTGLQVDIRFLANQ